MVYFIAIQSAAATEQALDAACQTTTAPPTGASAAPPTGASAAPTTGLSAACQNALTTLTTNTASCTPTQEDPLIICTGQCRQYYDDVINNCDQAVSQVAKLCEISCLCACPVINYMSIVSEMLFLDLYKK